VEGQEKMTFHHLIQDRGMGLKWLKMFNRIFKKKLLI